MSQKIEAAKPVVGKVWNTGSQPSEWTWNGGLSLFVENPFQQEIESGASASKTVGLLTEPEGNDILD